MQVLVQRIVDREQSQRAAIDLDALPVAGARVRPSLGVDLGVPGVRGNSVHVGVLRNVDVEVPVSVVVEQAGAGGPVARAARDARLGRDVFELAVTEVAVEAV